MNTRSRYLGAIALAVFSLVVASSGCSGASGGGFGNPHKDSGAEDAGEGDTGSAVVDSGAGGSDVHAPGDSGALDSGMHDTGPMGTGMDSGMVAMSSDGFSAGRTACINTINALRATQSLAPYTLIDDPATDMCLDEQATNDESLNSAHYSFINKTYPACSYPPFNAQDECEGFGSEPGAMGSGPHGTGGTGIIGCLYFMWAEQYNSNCLGCVGCTAFGGACAGCDYYGMSGPECGHYVNMSASYFSQAACGFATGGGSWSVQNFE